MFCPFTSLKPPKKQNFEKMKKIAGDIILLMCIKNNNHLMYSSWHTKWHRHSFLLFWAIFLQFYPSSKLENQNFEKMKNAPIDVIILHISIKNYDHMMYASWDWYGVQQTELFVTLGHFLPFYPLRTRKIKILKKRKNTWRYYQFTHVYHK